MNTPADRPASAAEQRNCPVSSRQTAWSPQRAPRLLAPDGWRTETLLIGNGSRVVMRPLYQIYFDFCASSRHASRCDGRITDLLVPPGRSPSHF